MSQGSGTQALPLQFTGQGGEYFRIWIVNLALTILTLGIYSAWAKVRRLQYFYRNTSLAGHSFDYHGNPRAILIGRLIGVGLLVSYNVAGTFDPILGLGALAVLLLVFPWLVQRSLRFKLHNSSYRGLRFAFDGGTGGAYKAFLMWPVMGYVTLGLLAPLAHQRIKSYQHANSRYGATPFAFNTGAGRFYGVYLKLIGLIILAGLILGALAGAGGVAALMPFLAKTENPEMHAAAVAMLVAGIMIFYLLLLLLIGPWFAARIQNLVWNGTSLGQHAFFSDIRARGLFWIYFSNFMAILFTLGLFKPFADIRLAKYRLERMGLTVQGGLDEFLAGQQQSVSAMGEETAEIFDFDISF